MTLTPELFQRFVDLVYKKTGIMFEENKRGTLQEVCDHFKTKTVKGEIVIVVAGKE